jgi:hypothetical protein
MNPFLKKSFQIVPSPFPSPPKAGERAGVRGIFSQLPLVKGRNNTPLGKRGARGDFLSNVDSILRPLIKSKKSVKAGKIL